MADTLRFQCQNCGEVVVQNPRSCPQCGESVLRPVETTEPGDKQHQIQTDEFEVDQALSRLESRKNEQSTASSIEEASADTSDGITDEEKSSLLERLKSLF